MNKSNYDKFPATKVDGLLFKGWEAIINHLQSNLSGDEIIAVDCYPGVKIAEIINAFSWIRSSNIFVTEQAYKSGEEIQTLTAPFLGDDALFGFRTNLSISDYFDKNKIVEFQDNVKTSNGVRIVIGTGAGYLMPQANILIYLDLARWEIIQRFRKSEINGLGVLIKDEPFSKQYKRGLFNDWVVCDKYKRSLFSRVDYWIDTHVPNVPKMIDNELFTKGIEKTIKSPFRVVPFFDPAPWGGQWMKETCDLDRSKSNYGWCFDCVPEENSLLLEVSGELFEIPSNDLVFLKSKELLGEAVEGRFGVDFPIRFDLLDTIGGGNLSLQVHPTTQYIRDTFGISYTQDESYYILATGQGGGDVFLGVKETTVPDEMIESLKAAEKGESIFDTEKFVNKFHAEKHDHFLIPGGTIHCSGENTLVLEISATPNIFTFKLWDWGRMGLDGKPRPINIEHGSKVINWKRNTSYVKQNLVNTIEKVAEGDGWHEERTGLHPAEFIETRRHWFEKKVVHSTHGSVNVLNLVEGDEAIVESPTNMFNPFTVHFAETFIIPAHIETYTITPSGKSKDLKCATIKAFVKFKA